MASRFEAGRTVREQVLGREYVERAMSRRTNFNGALQELVTEFCWGAIWTRDGLPREVRSLLNVAMMVAMNRPHELSLHVKGAVRNGCSEEQIAEVLLQAAVYAGVPAGVDGFRVASEALEEMVASGEMAATGEMTP